jgi:hypothetical protein
MMEQFCFTLSATCISRPNLGKDDKGDDEEEIKSIRISYKKNMHVAKF